MWAAMADGDTRPARTGACFAARSPLVHQVRNKRHPISARRNLNRAVIQLTPARAEQVSHSVERKARVEDGRHRVPPVFFNRPVKERLPGGIWTKAFPNRGYLGARSDGKEHRPRLDYAVAHDQPAAPRPPPRPPHSRFPPPPSARVTFPP